MKQINTGLKKYIVAEKYNGMTAEVYLKDVMKISSRNRQKLFRSKGVFVNGKAVHTKRLLKAGDMVAVRQFIDDSYGVKPQNMELDILYEDEAVIVLNKPAGMLVHPAGQTADGTLANYLAGYFSSKNKVVTIRPLHRLDRDTTGCILFAKKAEYQVVLEKQLAAGKIHRYYQAIVNGTDIFEAEAGKIDLPIGKVPGQPNRRRVDKASGQTAVTNYKVVGEAGLCTLLELWLETGRTHQIRVHLAHLGYPVLGDRMYGTPSRQISRQALHACKIVFEHPVSKAKIAVEAPLPADMKRIITI